VCCEEIDPAAFVAGKNVCGLICHVFKDDRMASRPKQLCDSGDHNILFVERHVLNDGDGRNEVEPVLCAEILKRAGRKRQIRISRSVPAD
jgi:hypothetical protein